jgi:hypothetical protein
MDDLLLIGTRFRQNEACKYTLDDFETNYGCHMGILGPERSFWELDERQIGVSLNKAIGVQISGTQKRHPQTSLKQSILARWKLAPQTANPAVLNQYLGVEISHCTGNARRIPIKHLLLMPPVWKLLGLQFPGWTETPWGEDFVVALLSEDGKSIFDVWTKFASFRIQMAALVSYVLELLDKTGSRGSGLVAAFLNNRQESSVTFQRMGNEWSCLLSDSHLTATYAAINSVCIECHTPDHSTAVCGGLQAYTVLDTRIAVDETRAPVRPLESRSLFRRRPEIPRPPEMPQLLGPSKIPDRIKIDPHGQVLKTVDRPGQDALLMVTGSSASTAGAHVLSSLRESAVHSGIEVRDLALKGGKQYKVFLRASTKSCGGMRMPRVHANAVTTQPTAINDEDPELSYAIELDWLLNSSNSSDPSQSEDKAQLPFRGHGSPRVSCESNFMPRATHMGRSVAARVSEVTAQDEESDGTAITPNTDSVTCLLSDIARLYPGVDRGDLSRF